MENTENQQPTLPEDEIANEGVGQVEESCPPEAETFSREQLDQLVAEAEQRGYLRGRNEIAKQMMDRTQLLGNPLVDSSQPAIREDETSAFAQRFLTRLPRGVWD